MYLTIHKVIGHIEERNGSKYLVFDSKAENKVVLKNTQTFGMELKWTETINGAKEDILRRFDENKIQYRWWFTIK